MSDKDEKRHLSEEERDQIQEALETIRQELKEKLTEISEEIDDTRHKLRDQREEVIGNLQDILKDLEQEKKKLLDEGIDPKEVEMYVARRQNEILEINREKLEKFTALVSKQADKVIEKAKKKMNEGELLNVRRG